MKPSARELITGEKPINENDGMMAGGPTGPGPGPRPGGPRGMRPGGRPGGPPEPEGAFTRQERAAMKDLVILDLVHALGGGFYDAIAEMGLKGTDPDPAMIRHFMDEAGKYADKMSPEVQALMNKLAKLPR
jgi:hypothetical protein